MNTHPALLPATRALRPWPDNHRFQHVVPLSERTHNPRARELPALSRPGDLPVVTAASTPPSSLTTTDRTPQLRLLEPPDEAACAHAIAFGSGDFRTPTELRPQPRVLQRGERLDFGEQLHATVIAVDATAARVVQLQFDRSGAALLQ